MSLKSGNITIVLILLLLGAIAVFALSKSLSDSQASVYTALDSHYQNPTIALSGKMDDPSKWESFENKKYGYSVKFPKQWPASTSKTERGSLDTYSRFLSSKIKLNVLVANSQPQTPQKPTTVGNNTYQFFESDANTRTATVKHNDLYYTISLVQDNYFANATEFNACFLNILKNFAFTK